MLRFGLRLAMVWAIGLGWAVGAAGQAAPATAASADAYVPTMTFDVASVRESKPDLEAGFTVGGGFTPHTGTVRLQNFSVGNLVGWGYSVNDNQIKGIPDALRRSMFNIEAKADSAANEKLAKLDEKQQQLEQSHMILVLLEDRFKLKAHWETRDKPTYDLVVSKRGKLVSTGAPPSAQELSRFGTRPVPSLYQTGSSMRGFEYIAHGATSTDIAEMLTGQFGRPVADKTGLSGKYDFDLKTHDTRVSDRKEDDTNPWPPLETAIEDQLGLRLIESHGPVQVLVIDHMEMPSEN